MDVITLVGPYVGVAVGWLLGLASQSLAARRHRTGAIGSALADLLEIRHRILGIKFVEEYLVGRAQPPLEAILQLRQLADTTLPSMAGLSDRYNRAVSTISETHPILAFNLRSKDAITQYMATWRAPAAGDGLPVQFLVEIEGRVRPALLEALEESIHELAEAHSLRTRFAVRKLVRKQLEIPEGAKSFFALLDTAMATAPVPTDERGEP